MGRISKFFYSIGDLFQGKEETTPLFTPEGLSTRDDAIEMMAKAYNILSEDQDALVEASVRAKNLQLQEDLIKAIPFEDVKTRDSFKFQEYNDKVLLNQLYSSDIRPSGISNTTLRTIAFRSTLVNQIIARRANQMMQFSNQQRNAYDIGFVIRPKSLEPPTLRQREDIKRLTEAIENLGFIGYDPIRGDFKDFVQMIIRDTLTLDAVAIERIYSRSGEVCAFKAVDAASIIPKFNPDIQDFEYQEFIEGQLEQKFDRKHMFYYVRNKTTDRRWLGFGMSELERSINAITTHLYAEEYNKRLLKSGHNLNGIVNLKGQVSRAQFQEFRRQFFSFLTGTENTSKVALINAPQGIEVNNGIRNPNDLGYGNLMDYIIKVLASAFFMDPVELNMFVGNGASGQQQSVNNMSATEFRLKYSKDAGLRPLIEMTEHIINRMFLSTITDEYEIALLGLDVENPKERQDYLIKSMKYKTLDEVRAEADLPPMEDQDLGMTMDNQYYSQMLMSKIQAKQQEGAPGMEEMPGGEGPDGDGGGAGPTMTEDQIQKVQSYLDDNGYTPDEIEQVMSAVQSGALDWTDFIDATGYEDTEDAPEEEEQQVEKQPQEQEVQQ